MVVRREDSWSDPVEREDRKSRLLELQIAREERLAAKEKKAAADEEEDAAEESKDAEKENSKTQKLKNAGSKAKTFAAGAGGFMGGLAIAGARRGKNVASGIKTHSNDNGNLFLIVSILIIFLDLTGFLGSPYSGFEFADFGDFSRISLNIIMSATFTSFFVFYIIQKIVSREWDKLSTELWSFAFFAFVISGFLLFNYWLINPKASIHFVYWILFGSTFIKSHEDNPSVYYFLTGLFLIIDFFGYSALQTIVVFRYFPFLSVITAFYVYGKVQNKMAVGLLIFITLTTAILGYSDVSALEQDGFTLIANEDRPTFEESYKDFKNGLGNILDSWQGSLNRRVQYAITGKVENNEYEPLGVYIERVQTDQPRYYDDDKNIVVWGNVQARTLDDPIHIQVGCYVKKDGEALYADNDDVDPSKKFSVFTFEEQDFICRFPREFREGNDVLGVGTKSITAYADFNFETLAYVKSYFINENRRRAMTMEGLDPFEEFDIKNERPISIFTNGPAEIGMETSSPLISVSDKYVISPRFSLNIKNRLGWEGKIKELKELVLFFPKGTSIVDPADDCNVEFEEVDIDSGYCETSCNRFVEDECKGVCLDEGKDNCEAACEPSYNKCLDECGFLFENDGEEYNGYRLDLSSAIIRDELKDFDRYRFFSCSFEPDIETILDDTPITTKFFVVKARYDYRVEKRVAVKVVKSPDTGISDVQGSGQTFDEMKSNLNEVGRLVQDISEDMNLVPLDIVLSVAEKESGFKHCEEDGTDCGKDGIHCSPDGYDCGVMQINSNTNAHSELFKVGNAVKYGCFSDESAYDINCNIKIGIGMLAEHYQKYVTSPTADADYTRDVKNNCNIERYRDRYLTYKKWQRALRRYNGLDCPNALKAAYVDNIDEFCGECLTD